jgi:hypothetical protein
MTTAGMKYVTGAGGLNRPLLATEVDQNFRLIDSGKVDQNTSGKSSAVQAPNLLLNGTAEFGNTGWTGTNFGAALDITGGGGTLFTSGAIASGTSLNDYSGFIPVATGINLTASAEVYTAGASAGQAYVRVDFYDNTQTLLVGSSFQTTPLPFNNGYTWVWATGAVPAGAAYCRVQKIADTSPLSIAGGIRFRRIKLEYGNAPSTYSQEATIASFAGSTSQATPPVVTYVIPAAGASTIPVSYTPGFETVYRNGTKQVRGQDYTAVDGAIITLLGYTCSGQDTFEIDSYTQYSVANVLTTNSPQINSGALTFADGTQQASAGAGRNRIINGDCRVAQYAAVSVVFGNTGYGGVDRYQVSNFATSGVVQQSQGTITFGGVSRPAVLQTATTALVLSATSAHAGIRQRIEGFNCFDLAGKPTALSFVFKASVSGLYAVSLNDAGNNSWVQTFTAIAGTAQRFTFPIPANSSASIPQSNAIGLQLNIGYIAGPTSPTNTTSLGVWSAGVIYSTTTSCVNWGATTSGYISATDIQLEAGTVATPFERLEYGESLRRCQRYYYTSYLPGQAPGLANAGPSFNTSSIGAGLYTTLISMAYPVMMRVTPTVTPYSPKTGASGMYYQSNNSADALASITASLPGSVTLSSQGNSPAVGNGLQVNFTASAEL